VPLNFYLTLAVIWIVPSIITAMIAARKGRSFGKWLLIGLIFSPGCAILMALFLCKRPSKAMMEKYASMEMEESRSLSDK